MLLKKEKKRSVNESNKINKTKKKNEGHNSLSKIIKIY